MPQLSFVTTVGSTADVRASRADVILVSEPDTGATLRTKGRLYLLFECAPPGPAEKIAREVAELTRQEYYYDLSAGIEVSLRRALRQANRRATQRLRESRGSTTLQCACAVIVNNELYTSRVGGAQVFLVRRARLFLPGDEPGELAVADGIRSRLDVVNRVGQRVARLLRGATTPVTAAATKSVAVGLELMPRRGAALPRHADTARHRSRRQRRAMTTLAVLLLVAATGVGALAYRDFEANRAGRDYALAVASAEDLIASAHRLADRKPPDPDGARERMPSANAKPDEASRSTFADAPIFASDRAD